MPEIKHGGFLLEHLQNMGYCSSGGMGITPLSFTEIKAYLDLMRIDLDVFHISTLRKMSVAYVSSNQDNYEDTEPPYKSVEYSEPMISGNNILKAFGVVKSI
ncbi:MAG: hypothetical protein U9O83_03525 [Campylobacterota bacterium]|nr:hypothetical protein [Campylobacterota bacterium]